MAYQKKIFILNDINSKEGTGIVKLIEDGGVTSAEVSIYGADKEKLTLLIKVENGLFAYVVGGKSTLDLSGFGIASGVDCLVINEHNKALFYGSTSPNKNRCFNLADEYARLQKNTKIATAAESDDKIFDIPEPSHETDNNIEITEAEEQEEQDFSDYSEGFTVNATAFAETSILGGDVNYEGDNFYLAVKPQLDEMFTCYPVDNELNDVVPSGKWVRVNTADDYYVVGVIYDLDEPKYICYGIHGTFAQKPPEEIKNACEWVPLDLSAPDGNGYWMIYQDCKTGKTITKTE